jgi:hypothetical protein
MAASDMVEKMRREQEYHRMHHERNQMMRSLIDAWHLGGDTHILRADAENLSGIIRDKIERHKQMIATLEWFGAHIALDKPEGDVLVTRVVLEGLASMERNMRESTYASAPDPFLNVAQQAAMKPWK